MPSPSKKEQTAAVFSQCIYAPTFITIKIKLHRKTTMQPRVLVLLKLNCGKLDFCNGFNNCGADAFNKSVNLSKEAV